MTQTISESAVTGAGAIAGARFPLFQETIKRTVPSLKQKPKKPKTFKLKENTQTVDRVTTSSLKELLRSKQKQSELNDQSEVFALEDNDGAIVKVYVQLDQAESFKTALENALHDAEDSGIEIAEVLFNLHKSFDIVHVEWGTGSIPEDEEVKGGNVANSIDAEDQGFPDTEELGDVDAEQRGTPEETSAIEDGQDDFGDLTDVADPTVQTASGDGAIDQVKLMNQIVALLQSQADAQRAKAEAEKAQADVAAAEAAAKAAAHYASHQEEVMDMENYNKHKQEEKRQSQIQAKLLRYRHDMRKDDNAEMSDKLNDPQYLLNTLYKANIGESTMNNTHTMPVTDPTPEEEEVLRMEDWEKEQKETQQQKKLRDRMIRYKYNQRKSAAASEPQGSEQPKQEAQGAGEPKKGSLMDYLLAARRNAAQE